MLQTNKTELQQKVSEDFVPDTTIVDQMTKMGFHPEIINMSLRYAANNMDEAVDMLLRMQGEGTYENLLTSILGTSSEGTNSDGTTPSTSSAASAIAEAVENVKRARLEDDVDAMAVRMICDFSFERFIHEAIGFVGIRTIF